MGLYCIYMFVEFVSWINYFWFGLWEIFYCSWRINCECRSMICIKINNRLF